MLPARKAPYRRRETKHLSEDREKHAEKEIDEDHRFLPSIAQHPLERVRKKYQARRIDREQDKHGEHQLLDDAIQVDAAGFID